MKSLKTVTTEELTDAIAVMDPFHVVRLAGEEVGPVPMQVQQAIDGHRGREGDTLCCAGRTLHTGAGLLA